MDKKPSPKFAALHGLPSGLARRIVPVGNVVPIKQQTQDEIFREIAREGQKALDKNTPAKEKRKRRAKKALAEATAKPSSKRAQRWREKNPELWRERQRLAAKKHRAKKRAEKEQG